MARILLIAFFCVFMSAVASVLMNLLREDKLKFDRKYFIRAGISFFVAAIVLYAFELILDHL